MSSFHEIRVQALRLERYCWRSKNKIWRGDRRDLIDAMADVAEAGEIARRLYLAIQKHVSTPALHTAHPLQDEAHEA
jgi:hypothetical protein